MWIFTPDSFISIVDKGDPTGMSLLVRARRAGDIERIFPNAIVEVGQGTDYRYRARINRGQVSEVLMRQVQKIAYPNFKGAVSDPDRHDAYLEVWQSMYEFQGRN